MRAVIRTGALVALLALSACTRLVDLTVPPDGADDAGSPPPDGFLSDGGFLPDARVGPDAGSAMDAGAPGD